MEQIFLATSTVWLLAPTYNWIKIQQSRRKMMKSRRKKIKQNEPPKLTRNLKESRERKQKED